MIYRNGNSCLIRLWFPIDVALYHLKHYYMLDNLSRKYGFSSCIAGMKCAVTDDFASIVLCDK